MSTRRRATHLDEERLHALATGTATTTDEEAHVESCARCRRELDFVRTALEAGIVAPTPCPDPEQLFLLAHQRLEGDDLLSTQRHLTRCAACAIAAEDIINGESHRMRPARFRPSVSAVGAAAGDALAARLRALVDFVMPEPLHLATRGAAEVESSTRYREALAAYERDDYASAASAFQDAREEGEEDSDLMLLLGACLLDLERGADAIAVFEEAVASSPRLGELRWYLAQALLLQGDGERALEQARLAAKLPGAYRAVARPLVRQLEVVMGSS